MARKYITKKQVESIFKEEYVDLIKNETKTTIRCAWNDFTDFLCKDGMISENQCCRWTYPNFCK